MIIIILVAAAVVVAERLIKRKVEEKGEDWRGTLLGGNVQRRKVFNPGLMLGFLKEKQFFANILAGTALCGVAVYTIIKSIKGMAFMAKLGWGLLLGGGLSNLLERVLKGRVTDYFSFCRAIPKKLRRVVFNIADMCAFVGALIAVIFDR